MGITSRISDYNIRITLLGGIIVLAYLGVLAPTGLIQNPRLHTQDHLLQLRNRLQEAPAAAQGLVLVEIDDLSIQSAGQQWPWDRSAFAKLVQKIGEGNPRLVAMDLAFVGERTQEGDQAFANAIREGPPILLAAFIDPLGNYVPPLAALVEAGAIPGLVNKPRDRDLIVRRIWPAIDLPGGKLEPEYAMELKMAAYALNSDPEHISVDKKKITISSLQNLRLRQVPLEVGFTFRLNPLASIDKIPHVSFGDVISGKAPPSTFQDKIVLVGTTTEITHDIYPTPLGLAPGVTLSANGFLTLMTERYLRPMPMWLTAVSFLVLSILIGLAAFHLPVGLSMLLMVSLIALAVGLGFCAVLLDHLTDWLSPVFIGISSWGAGAFYRHFSLLSTGAELRSKVITDVSTGALTGRQGKMQMLATYQKARKSKHAASILLAELLQSPGSKKPLELEPKALKNITEEIRKPLPKDNVLSRLDTRRFCAILPGATAAEAAQVASQIADSAAGKSIAIGVADTQFSEIRSSRDWLACAEAALPRARQQSPHAAVFDPLKDQVVLGLPESEISLKKTDQFTELIADLEERNLELEKSLEERRLANQDIQEAFLNTAKVLVRALETKDPYTAGHSERVSRYAGRLAERVNLPPEEVEEIREAGLLHDIGKIGIPDEVMHKVGKLTDKERGLLKNHHAGGTHILEPLKKFKRVVPLIYYHHEAYDGTGYPHGLTGDLIPTGAQIITIVDSYDAMTTNRGYNEPKTPEEGLAEIQRCSGTQFNPNYVDAFAKMIREEGKSLAAQ